jgi:hypothetical protein
MIDMDFLGFVQSNLLKKGIVKDGDLFDVKTHEGKHQDDVKTHEGKHQKRHC